MGVRTGFVSPYVGLFFAVRLSSTNGLAVGSWTRSRSVGPEQIGYSVVVVIPIANPSVSYYAT